MLFSLYYLLFASIFLLSFAHVDKIIPVQDPQHPIFAFGSCNRYRKDPNPIIFNHITQQNPDVWAWVGDIAYVSNDKEQTVLNDFDDVKNAPLYTELRTKSTVIGTWDDHDYGVNDGNKHFKYKERNKQFYLDFLDESQNSSRRTRDGVYESYYLGQDKRIKIILLDVRYNRDPRLSFGTDMLGEKQWNWLEEEIKENQADFTLIASGSQILPDDRIFPEHWFDKSRQRLLDLIQKYKVSGVILLSGDVHYAEIMKHPCPQRVGYNLYEFTSSGLTHYISEYIPFGGQFFNELFPHTFNTPKDRFIEKNFGILRFSFEGNEPKVLLEVRNDHGNKVMEKEILYRELEFKEEILDFNSTCVLDTNGFYRIVHKYVREIWSGNLFLIKYTIAVGLIGLGFVSILAVIWIKRNWMLGLFVYVYRKLFKGSQKEKEN